MENYNEIPKTGTIGGMVDNINANFQLTKEMLERLEVTKDHAVGLFSTLATLQAAYPSPEVGDWALVGDTTPFAVYKCATAGSWSDTGGTYDGGEIDLTDYATKAEFDGIKDVVTNNFPSTTIEPTLNSQQPSSNKRWRIEWYDVAQNGDILTITCQSGYEVYVGLVEREVYVKTYTDYIGGTFTLNYQDGAHTRLRVTVKRTDGGVISQEDIEANVSFSMKRYTNLPSTLSDLDTRLEAVEEDIAEEVIEPTSNGMQASTRWRIDWNSVMADGDILTVTCQDGYEAYVGLVVGSTYVKTYTDYTSGTFTMNYQDGEGKLLRILIKKSDDSRITKQEVEDNVSFSVTRPSVVDQLMSKVDSMTKSLRILFVGNSLTQDAVSYLPLLLQDLAPELDFKIYIWYNGGKTLTQQLAYFNDDTPCEIFSVCENTTSWTNTNNSVTMSSILSTYQFDIVCLQEYFNYKSEYSASDKADFQSVVDYIKAHYSGTFKVVTLLHQPKRDNPDSIFRLTFESNKWLLDNTVVTSVIPAGAATYKALSTDLDSLGDQGHLSPDGTHSQEGLPCMLQAYVTALWVFDQFGIQKGVLNNAVRVTASNYSSIHVPGPNLGSGVVEGTEAQNYLAQQVATVAYTEYMMRLFDVEGGGGSSAVDQTARDAAAAAQTTANEAKAEIAKHGLVVDVIDTGSSAPVDSGSTTSTTGQMYFVSFNQTFYLKVGNNFYSLFPNYPHASLYTNKSDAIFYCGNVPYQFRWSDGEFAPMMGATGVMANTSRSITNQTIGSLMEVISRSSYEALTPTQQASKVYFIYED